MSEVPLLWPGVALDVFSFEKNGGGARPGLRCELDIALQGFLAHKNLAPIGPYSRNMLRAFRWSYGGELFIMSEVPLVYQSTRPTLK